MLLLLLLPYVLSWSITFFPPFLLFSSGKERLYPVADATTFFTDLHYILRVIAAGNIRTVCHNRLNLLEHVIFSFVPFYFENDSVPIRSSLS